MGLFRRRRHQPADTNGLGRDVIARRLDDGDVAPAACRVVIFNPGGHARRAVAGKINCAEGETVFCFHPGPYRVDLTPFAAAPELGLRLRFVIDAADPRVVQQRFDLFLYSEVEASLEVDDMRARIDQALQAELAQGPLELPPCTTLDEWHAFRSGLNQLLYTRLGITVDDCVPVDLGDQVDYADMLTERALRAAAVAAPMPAADLPPDAVPNVSPNVPPHLTTTGGTDATPGQAPPPRHAAPSAGQPPAVCDARALRRLFLELPALSTALRLLALPAGQAPFQVQQDLLRRLALLKLNVDTMPSLAWAAPDQPLEPHQQARRSRNSTAAVAALDEAWALLARLQLAVPVQWAELSDEASRICANLEYDLALRRAPYEPIHEDELLDQPAPSMRREPKL
ncbi:hypothetical protein H3H36_25400 [Duganella sp. FT3S]|uniref:Uncharacterized protein n=1 Tax=Rugamonas fusca TaxID=2758568 RepID=A0A7W2EML5_9BURK|nr:hypothetical protein [Rugamonas fusca]MBA5608683.1 hypothetical protein [Rugamonas fusca]